MSFLRKVVRNDAMRSDPPEIYGWRVVLLACSACFGAASFGMDGSIISGVIVLPQFIADYGLQSTSSIATANLQANIVSTLQAGCFAGALAAGPLADRYGRRTILLCTAVVTFLGVVMQFNAWGQLAVLYVGRFIAGLGVGAASMVNPLYISENAPRAIRGALTGLYQLLIVTGGMIAFWINYGAALHLHGKTTYVLPLAVQGLPALLLFVCMLFCNESPRWMAKQDRWEEARAILCRLRTLPSDHPYIDEEFSSIVTQLQNERELIGDATFMNLQREMWTIPGNRKRAIISICLMICQQMTGTNAITQYAPIIFQNVGITGSNTSLFATGIYGIVKSITCACFLLFLADTLGRRRSLLWTSVAQGLCMFYIGLYVRISPPVKGQDVPPQGYVALACIYLFAAFFQLGWGATCWIYVSEIPSARLRSLNVALAAATQWLFNFVSARAVPTMLVSVGAHGYGTYFIFGCFCFCWFPFVWFFVPETKGLSLEAMDDLFGVTALHQKTGDDLDTVEKRISNDTAKAGHTEINTHTESA